MAPSYAIGSRFHDRYCMYRYAQAGPLALAPPDVAGLQTLVASPDSVSRVFHDDARLRMSFSHFLTTMQARGVFLAVEGEWVCHLWMTMPGRARPPHIKPGTAPDAFWFFYGATRPGYGSLGLFKYAQRVLLAEAFQHAAHPEILADPQVDNYQSRRAHLSSGFAEAGMLDCSYLWLPRLSRIPLSSRWDRTAPHPPLVTPAASIPRRAA